MSYRSFVAMVFIASILGACAGDADRYPSLAFRDAERIESLASPNQTAPLSLLNETNMARVAALLGQARESHQEFLRQRSDALSLAQTARGLSSEDDKLARAKIAVAKLSSLRGSTAIALGGLDELYAEAASSFVETNTIEVAQADVGRMIAEQDKDLAGIERILQ